MGKPYWLSLSIMQECNLLHPINVIQDAFLRWIMPIPFFLHHHCPSEARESLPFWPFLGERKVLPMDSWGCVCCFGCWEEFQSLPHSSQASRPASDTAALDRNVPRCIPFPWISSLLKHAHLPSRHANTIVRTVIKHSERDTYVEVEARRCFIFPIEQAVVLMTFWKCLSFVNLYIFIDLMCVLSSNICIVSIIYVILENPVDRGHHV